MAITWDTVVRIFALQKKKQSPQLYKTYFFLAANKFSKISGKRPFNTDFFAK